MKLHVRHVFPFTVEQFWACFDDPDWNAAEHAASDIVHETIEERTEGDTKLLHQRVHTGMKLPGMIASRLGADTLTFEQISRIHKAQGRLDWEVIPPAMRDKITARGTMVVKPVAGGCEQVIEGDVSVNVPLVGGTVEKAVVEGIAKSHKTAAERRERWMKAKYG